MSMSFGGSTKQTVHRGYQSPVLESFNHDGMDVARRRTRKKVQLPYREVFLFALAVIAFKVFLYLDMGPASYGAKVSEFREGGTIEQMAGFAMTLDPVSRFVVELMTPTGF